MQYPDDERRELLKYSVAPALDRDAVARYALGDRSLAGQILAPFRTERFKPLWSGFISTVALHNGQTRISSRSLLMAIGSIQCNKFGVVFRPESD